ncbi:hypothetical protein [Methanosarcina mazei]|nr:hypothetical protein [Methanosarcina mazei]
MDDNTFVETFISGISGIFRISGILRIFGIYGIYGTVLSERFHINV